MSKKIKLSDTFRTPVKEIYKPLDELFNFFWDACCNKDNCLVEDQKTFWDDREYDYLTENLLDNFDSGYENCSIFMNPPYSNPLPFIKKAWEDSKHFRVVMLLKADMSTKWFNYALSENASRRPVHHNQFANNSGYIEPIWNAAEFLYKTMDKENRSIGILHLRNRVKFYVSEEVFLEDTNWKDEKGKYFDLKYDYSTGKQRLMETKNYKRVEDGIISKSGANFPSMIMIFDRRGNK